MDYYQYECRVFTTDSKHTLAEIMNSENIEEVDHIDISGNGYDSVIKRAQDELKESIRRNKFKNPSDVYILHMKSKASNKRTFTLMMGVVKSVDIDSEFPIPITEDGKE